MPPVLGNNESYELSEHKPSPGHLYVEESFYNHRPRLSCCRCRTRKQKWVWLITVIVLTGSAVGLGIGFGLNGRNSPQTERNTANQSSSDNETTPVSPTLSTSQATPSTQSTEQPPASQFTKPYTTAHNVTDIHEWNSSTTTTGENSTYLWNATTSSTDTGDNITDVQTYSHTPDHTVTPETSTTSLSNSTNFYFNYTEVNPFNVSSPVTTPSSSNITPRNYESTALQTSKTIYTTLETSLEPASENQTTSTPEENTISNVTIRVETPVVTTQSTTGRTSSPLATASVSVGQSTQGFTIIPETASQLNTGNQTGSTPSNSSSPSNATFSVTNLLYNMSAPSTSAQTLGSSTTTLTTVQGTSAKTTLTDRCLTRSSDGNWTRTVIFITLRGSDEQVFIRGGVPGERGAIPIRDDTSICLTENCTGLVAYNNSMASNASLSWNESLPLLKTSNNSFSDCYFPLNTYGDNLGTASFMMDCSSTYQGWFALKTYRLDFEEDIQSAVSCRGFNEHLVQLEPEQLTLGDNHFGQCGKINRFTENESLCVIENFP